MTELVRPAELDRYVANDHDSSYSTDALVAFATSLLSAAGMDDDKARTVARLLVLTDMMGRRTHGLAIAPLYIDDIRKGAMQVTGEPEVMKDSGAQGCSGRGLTYPGCGW